MLSATSSIARNGLGDQIQDLSPAEQRAHGVEVRQLQALELAAEPPHLVRRRERQSEGERAVADPHRAGQVAIDRLVASGAERHA